MSAFTVQTKGHYDFVNLTDQVADVVRSSGVQNGVAIVFVSGTTVGLTVLEDEEGIKRDLAKLWEQWAPEDADYEHHRKWGDHNGAAHLKSALLGTSVSVPIADGKLQLGQWQSIMLIDFDERPRERTATVSIVAAQ